MNLRRLDALTAVVFWGAGFASLSAQPAYPTDPAAAQLICTDVEHFITAQSKIASGASPVPTLQTHYLDAGTPGLAEFLNRHEMSAAQLAAAMAEIPETYAKIPSWLQSIDSLRTDYVALLEHYQTVIPDAMFPPTYLLVGDNKGIAQASRPGQLVTITRVLDRPAVLLNITMHELTHFQQALTMGFGKYVGLYAEPDNMLALILREGGAEFVTYLVTGRISQTKALAYLEAHEAELKQRFREDLAQQETKFWLWETLEQDEIPALLGYVIGFKICQAYYDSAPDKATALIEILRMDDPTTFLTQSNYL